LGDGFFLIGVFEEPKSEITATDNTTFSTADSEDRWPDFILAGNVEGKDWHVKLPSILLDLKTCGDGPFPKENALEWGVKKSRTSLLWSFPTFCIGHPSPSPSCPTFLIGYPSWVPFFRIGPRHRHASMTKTSVMPDIFNRASIWFSFRMDPR
jgi:hypothetical protein